MIINNLACVNLSISITHISYFFLWSIQTQSKYAKAFAFRWCFLKNMNILIMNSIIYFPVIISLSWLVSLRAAFTWNPYQNFSKVKWPKPQWIHYGKIAFHFHCGYISLKVSCKGYLNDFSYKIAIYIKHTSA